MFGLEDLNLVLSWLVVLLLLLIFFLKLENILFEVMLLIVEFVFKSEEMLVKRDTVTQESLITACLVLLVNFTVLKKLDFSFHQNNLSLHVQDVLLFEMLSHFILLEFITLPLLLFMTALEVWIAFKFLITNSSMSIIFSSIARGKVAACWSCRFFSDSTIYNGFKKSSTWLTNILSRTVSYKK